MDVHVPSSISAGLRRRGLDVLTSQEDGTDRWDDARLLERATSLDRVLFSQDDDLLRLASAWHAEGRPFPGVIYAHQMSAGIGALVQDLELVLKCGEPNEIVGRVVFLPLS
jgi:hypothetical protein